MKHTIPAALLLVLAGCPKAENAGGGTGTGSTPSGGTTSSTTPVPLATSAAPSASEPATTTTKTPPPPASVASAKGKDAAAPPAAKLTQAHVDGKNFALDLAAPSCKADTECAVTIKLAVSGDFHVNKEYPYKFVGSPAPNVTFLGKGDANTFSKAAGDFAQEGEKSATMTVRYKPSSAGQAKVSGTYKLSVCNPDQCQIEQQPISIDVPVL
jgi:hypothetical protein